MQDRRNTHPLTGAGWALAWLETVLAAASTIAGAILAGRAESLAAAAVLSLACVICFVVTVGALLMAITRSRSAVTFRVLPYMGFAGLLALHLVS
ncbi:hypothetical protein ACIBG7_43375 [Nonomuraea sp. NPDC050328]|uniref:hypothetical protein n=1 Tax=Nonomuraea sp. NPDC050328 TaxID=3364361 RepID=UPI0037893CB2